MLPKRLINFALIIHNATQKGLLLFAATLVAIIIANSHYIDLYNELFETHFILSFGSHQFSLSLRDWINDLLMAIFFFSVGMEIKRELIVGNLANKNQRKLPIYGALGGVVFPILIFFIFNRDETGYMNGWAIPAATDIAFALGVLAVVGKSIPKSLKVFLTALAIIDDLVAVLIIAVFYTVSINFTLLAIASFFLILLWYLAKKQICSGLLYMVVGAIVWSCFLGSGIHATIAGVILGLLVPIKLDDGRKMIESFEFIIHPIVSYFIIPIFAFANSGVNLLNISIDVLYNPLVLGTALGLFLGKQCGVFSTVWVLVKTKLAVLPEDTTFLQFYGVSILCGIGFTMSLFIGVLAFSANIEYISLTKIGVILGSFLSCLFGIIILNFSKNKQV